MQIDPSKVQWDAPDASQVKWDDDKPKKSPTVAERVAMGAADPIHGGAQLLTKLLPESVVQAGNRLNNWLADSTGLVARLPAGGVDQAVREREAAYQAQRGDGGIDWARLAGNVASPVNLAAAAAAPARLAGLGGRMTVGAGVGGAAAATAPVTEGDFASEKAKQIATGAAFGGATPAVTAGLGRLISPRASTNPELQTLLKEGVRPTIGQTLGGAANRIEEKATSLPIVGDAIVSARNRASDDLNKAVANRALKPIGQTAPDLTGRELVAHVQKQLGDAYDSLLPGLTVKADQQWNNAIQSLRTMVSSGSISPESARTFNKVVKSDVLSKFRGQQALTGETMKQIESDLGQQVARFGASTDPDMRLVSNALREVQDQLRRLVERSNPSKAKELRDINTGYANFKRLERAASYIGAEDGAFNASQLQSAVKALDRSKDKGKFARGEAFMQDLSDPAKNVLGAKVPDSGTAGRLMNLPNAAALATIFAEPMSVLAPAAGFGAYTSPVQSLLRSAVSSRPTLAEPVAGLLNRTSPMLAPAGGLLGIEMLNQ